MKDTIRNHIQTELLGGRKMGFATRLLTDGWVNSLEMVAVKGFLERQFHVRIPDEMFTRESFDSVDSMARLLEKLGIR